MKYIILKKYIILILFILSTFFSKTLAQSTFSPERLEKAIIEYIQKQNICESEVSFDEVIKSQKFVRTGIKATINHKQPLAGPCKVNIDFLCEDDLVRSQEIRVTVKLFANVPTVTRFIRKDEELKQSDIAICRADVTQIDPNSIINNIEMAIGKKSRNGMVKGEVIKYNDLALASEITIKKGDKIKLIHYSGAICIKTVGFALENGTPGSVIKVKKDNAQTLYGFIADDGNVIIEDKQSFGRN